MVAAAEAGALIGGASSQAVLGVGEFATHLGLAFQIHDDILDVEGGAELGKDLGKDEAKPEEVQWHANAPEGKLDLLVTLDFRMSTTCLYSDIVLPTATWYEKNDLNTSDMHPFIHPLSTAVDPAWQAKSDWEIYKGFAKAVSEVSVGHLGVEKDVVLTPIMHDTAGEMAQPYGVRDWKRGECELIPGKTAPQVTVVERDYPNLYKRFTALGPLMEKVGNGGKGIGWNTQTEVGQLGDLNGRVKEEGVTVQAGDTAGRIANAYKPAGVSLDQMLVAMMRTNPDAFIQGNVNRLRAGAVLQMPDQAAAQSTTAPEARQILAAQARDFNDFRRKLAGA
eukprot:gene18947-26824_t